MQVRVKENNPGVLSMQDHSQMQMVRRGVQFNTAAVAAAAAPAVMKFKRMCWLALVLLLLLLLLLP
jgi:hypothetical protein